MTAPGPVGMGLSVSETLSRKPQAAVRPVEVETNAGPSAFAQLVHGLGREINGGEAMMRSAVHSASGNLDPAELLALQAGVYRYSEAIDLASKLVDHATSSVKTVIQGSGQ